MNVDNTNLNRGASSTGEPLLENPITPLSTPLVALPQSESQEETNASVARATGVLALGNIASRILGLVREIVISNLFGATGTVAAYKVAILVPKGLYDLLIGGHINGAIIPVLSEVVTVKGRDELWRLVSVLLSMLTVILAALVLLLQFAAPLLVEIFGGGLNAPTQALAVDLLRLTSPALIFMGMFAIISATLYALRVFTWPAFATAVFNATIVVIALIFAPAPRFIARMDGPFVEWAFTRPDQGIMVIAVGWLAGSVAYVLLQLPGLKDARLTFTLIWKHPAIGQIGLLYIPVMFSLVMDTLIIRPFSYNLASRTGESSIPYMDLATTLIQFPQGLVATAISIAILPTLSRQAALIVADRTEVDEARTAFQNTLGLGLRLAITLILPATVGLFVLATPIVALIFQHGAFNAVDTAMTSKVLRLYLFGLPFAAVDLLLVYAFYARQDTLTPAAVGLFSLAAYMGIALVLMPHFGLLSLMIADSAKHIIHATISGYLLQRRLGGLMQQGLILTAAKAVLASLLMGSLTAILLIELSTYTVNHGFLGEALVVGVCGGLSAGLFALLAYLLNLEEWRWMIQLIKRRLG